ncbi:DNA-binding GntR family transcriptional regulator [Streptomyces sp. SAI-135]|jgi:DNA-binding GntR family transcriptional regulator|uniref:GntR family transcriptional regulator n=1 Tax=unclassified Streptomyces TaxID=2593676 RepID=UPI002474512D|nr:MULTISPECIES: GntR family transcriptional regulator [unclassified Streptomyces]MDH6522845.1 DNA-binding GntR family transcriptional regulator [Streptomyces sp. SAI-090]MDH6554465.1 DNA-binding GntR family transcriptional regulator [Streptomyces sp. SAI-041]MDH6573732.1 DNA-binding GntR family transcriptional regulator [Streptomyces sp. SAI-117]MDH6581537.1 DNA-binding GntR family transcriptional regulator [Streptomyces sp. SAI-133]MDH6613540.1 DNA-binding GntR family transcriptional regulat
MIERPENLTDLVFAAIRKRMIDASLPPGSSVSEAMLSKDLKVSKTPVREALLQMRQIGLVAPSGRGLRVVVPTARIIRDAFEMRAGLEAAAARYAADRATREQKNELVELAQASAGVADDFEAFRDADTAFHQAVAAAADNAMLHKAVEDAVVLTQVLRQRDVHVERDFAPDSREHIRIAQAIKSGDSAAAADRLSEHILRIMEQLLEAFGGKATSARGLRPAGLRSPA